METSVERKIIRIMQDNAEHAWFATVEGVQPRVRPVSPVVEDDMSIWVTTFKDSRKVMQITTNNNVTLAFMELPLGEKAVFVMGKAEIIENPDDKKRVWKLVPFDLFQYFPEGPGSELFCLLKISIEKIEWREDWKNKMNVYLPAP